jgi:hypothetical protein
MAANDWRKASARHMAHPAGWSIVKVCSVQVTRYELYGMGKYWGWRESAKEAMALFDEVSK